MTTSATIREPSLYPSLSKELGISNKQYNVPLGESDVDKVLGDPGLTPNELNSTIYKNDFKSFRECLSKDVSKYHSLERRYLKILTGITGFTWFLGFISFALSGIDAIMSSMIYNGNSTSLSQEQFNYAMVVTNWIEIIFSIFAGLLQVFYNRIQGDVSKHTAHKTKAREYMNILQVDFDSAYSDKIITTDEMQTISNLRTQYEAEQAQISLSGAYYTSSGSAAPVAIGQQSTRVNIPLVQPTNLNTQQQSFLTLLASLGGGTTGVTPTSSIVV